MPSHTEEQVEELLGRRDFEVGVFFQKIKSSHKAIAFAVYTGLLPIEQGECPVCGSKMNLVRRSDVHVSRQWSCPCRKRIAVTSNTWFSNTRIPVKSILRLMVHWFCKTPVGRAAISCIVSKDTAIDYYTYCREVCAIHTTNDVVCIGGRNLHVEIDETHLCRRKYPNKHLGRKLKSEDIWVFGGICRETNERFAMIVPDRKKTTLWPIIKQRIAPGSIILHDAFKTYDNLSKLGYRHLTINHSVAYVDPSNRALHTNKVERFWRDLKANVKSYQGDQLIFYIQEYIYRRMHLEDPVIQDQRNLGETFRLFVKDAIRIYPGPFCVAESYDMKLMAF